MLSPRALLTFAALVLTTNAGLAAATYLQNLNGADSAPLPTWMEGPPMATPAKHATVSFPIKPPAAEDDLLVTVFFNEQPGGFLRVYWDDGFNKEMLTENLAEGTGMANRRTLVIKRRTMVARGLLTFQASGTTLGVDRIHWQWNRLQPAYLDDAFFPGGVLGRSGEWLRDDEIDGLPATPRTDFWQGEVVTAPIITSPVRIERGVKFVAELPEMPKFVRVHARISGLPLGNKLMLWVNEQPAGEVSVVVPDLSDPGLAESQEGTLAYTGWRDVSLMVDASLFKIGENHFYFAPEKELPALAVKDFDVQLQYPK
ncbi:MAG TPA: hypothetical protein VF585_01110 [Chthoniobacterales bacterium]|jgi:hypothetical protein